MQHQSFKSNTDVEKPEGNQIIKHEFLRFITSSSTGKALGWKQLLFPFNSKQKEGKRCEGRTQHFYFLIWKQCAALLC